jgi:thioredoxin reductase
MIAIVGAGPIGIEMALRARAAGHEVKVYEAGRIGEHFRRYGTVRLFTPFRMNSTALGRERLRAAGVELPDGEAILTGDEFRLKYLLPLSKLPDLDGSILEGSRVSAIAREGFSKSQSGGSSPRAERPFLLQVEGATHRADVVIDASGVYATPNATGPGGLPAFGEESLGDLLECRLPDFTRYAGKRILLIGDGRSAANALAELDTLAQGTRVTWIHRERGGSAFSPIPAAELEQLPVLRELDERVGRIARGASWIERRPGATVESYRVLPSGGVEVTLNDPRKGTSRVEVDRVLALVGYRPDLSLFRELQIHLCYTSEGPMALAAAILAAQAKDPTAQGCLGQAPHGPDSLKSPEPDFYVLGAKSYGRNPNFLLTVGHQQIEDVMTLIGRCPRPPVRSASPAHGR